MEFEITMLCLVHGGLFIALSVRFSEKSTPNMHNILKAICMTFHELSMFPLLITKKLFLTKYFMKLISTRAQEQRMDYLDRLDVFMSAGFEEISPRVF